MSLEASVLFIPKQELLLPFDTEVDDALAVGAIQAYEGEFVMAGVKEFANILRLNFHFGIELDEYPDGSGGAVHLTDMKGTRIPLTYADGEEHVTTASTDGVLVHSDITSLIAVGEPSQGDFRVFAGFCTTPDIKNLDPDSTDYTRLDTRGHMPWVAELLGYEAE